jgi:hypothetical protein
MTFYNNINHFLHKHLTFIESTGIDGKNGRFNKFLFELGISASAEYWEIDHSTINWNKVDNHFQFFFDYQGNVIEIKNWLKDSELKNHDFLYTWLSWEDPIIRIKTKDLIDNWEEFNIASGWEGVIFTTIDGKYFFEFTDDWKYHLNSNFEIKLGTKINKASR